MNLPGLATSRIEYFQRQQDLYERAKPELIKQYLSEFVAFEDGVVLDHDLDERKLAERVYRRFGYRDLLIKQVWQQEPTLSVGSLFHPTEAE